MGCQFWCENLFLEFPAKNIRLKKIGGVAVVLIGDVMN